MIHKRIDPARDRRRLVLFLAGLVIFYLAAVLIARPEVGGGEDELAKFVVGVMFAPTVGALLAVVFGPGIIRFGMPSWWLLAGFLPALVVFSISLLASVSDQVELHGDRVTRLAVVFVPLGLVGCVTAIGEEIGWRGFLWPLMRRRVRFVASAAVMYALWWVYHAPLTILGWYGFDRGLPAFSVALLGAVLFVGVLTERSRSLWPSVLTHGSWNGLVAACYSTSGAEQDRTFTGDRYLLGEFGWLAALGMLVLGVGFAWWHLRTPTKDGLSPTEPTGYRSALMWLWFRNTAKADTPAPAT